MDLTAAVRRMATIALAVAFVGSACSATPPAQTGTPTSQPTSPTSPTSPASPSPTGGTAVDLPDPETTDLTFAWSASPAPIIIVSLVAEDLYEKYGLNVETIAVDGAAQASQALIAGQVDVIDTSAGPIIGSLATDSPLLMVFVARHDFTDILYSQGDVTTADDLRGKSIAISSFGASSHAQALVAVRSLGLSDDEVTFQPIGGDSDRMAALRAGSVAAAMGDAVNEGTLTAEGFFPLVNLSEVENVVGGNPSPALVVTREFAEQNPNTVLALVAAQLEAMKLVREDPDAVAEVLAEKADMDLEEARSQLRDFVDENWEPKDGRCDPAVMEFAKELAVISNPDLADVDVSQACTNEFIDRLEELGFHDAIGFPEQ